MTIAPTNTPQLPQYPRWTLPVERKPIPDPGANPTPPSEKEPPEGSTPRGPREMSLTKLIAQLSKQLKAIELTFMRALQALNKSVEAAPSDGASPAGSTRQASGASVPNPYGGLIRRAAMRNELDPTLLQAVVRAESGFNPRAVSQAGAMGLMQLMPDTAKSLGVTDPYDPAQNVDAGARMLRGLIDQYGGRLDLALAAYNAGTGAVEKYGGVPPYPETRNYVRSILQDYKTAALRA